MICKARFVGLCCHFVIINYRYTRIISLFACLLIVALTNSVEWHSAAVCWTRQLPGWWKYRKFGLLFIAAGGQTNGFAALEQWATLIGLLFAFCGRFFVEKLIRVIKSRLAQVDVLMLMNIQCRIS